MAQDQIKTAVLIGAGNLGWHLGQIMAAKGIRIQQVVSRTGPSGKELAAVLHADHTTSLKQLKSAAGIIIITVPDDQITTLISQVNFGDNLVVHTAGSVPLDVFNERAANYGVLYPLMTFTRKKPVDFKSVPLLIEANSKENTAKLRHFAATISGTVTIVTSRQRKIIHLAAVMASNFPNHMYALAEDLLNRNGISFDLLQPLILETTDKIRQMSPLEAQTGPAVRNDTGTMEEHLALLADDASMAEIYRKISKSIITFAGKQNEPGSPPGKKKY